MSHVINDIILLSAICGFVGCRSSETVKSPVERIALGEQTEEVFELIERGDKKTANGSRLGFSVYKGASGSEVVVTYGTLRSAARAQNELQSSLDVAKKIISNDEKKNILGLKVGYRAVAIYEDPNSKKDFSAVLWTDGARFWEIDCFSMETALDFEKRIERGGLINR